MEAWAFSCTSGEGAVAHTTILWQDGYVRSDRFEEMVLAMNGIYVGDQVRMTKLSAHWTRLGTGFILRSNKSD